MSDLSAGETDCLAVLWEAHAGGEAALKLSEVHRRVCGRREQNREAPPALTTVSTYLRTLVTKKLLQEIVVGDANRAVTYPPPTRGVLPTTRSPRTGYRAAHPPGEVLEETFKALVRMYPEAERWKAVVDFARATLKLPEKKIRELEVLLRRVE